MLELSFGGIEMGSLGTGFLTVGAMCSRKAEPVELQCTRQEAVVDVDTQAGRAGRHGKEFKPYFHCEGNH